jgi:ABC-2 type transport system permease protein
MGNGGRPRVIGCRPVNAPGDDEFHPPSRLSAGILAQGVLFTAISFGISAMWERDLGILHRSLVSPAARPTLVIGKFRGFSQSIITCVSALLLGTG